MEDKEYTLDIVDMVKLLQENRKPIARMTGLCILIGILYVILAVLFFPKYESEALLQMKQDQKGGGGLLAALAGNSGADFLGANGQQIGSYEEILKSRGVVIPVIEATEEKRGIFEKKYPRYEKYVEKRIFTENVKMTDMLRVTVNAKTPEQAQKANQLLLENFLKRITDLNSEEKGYMRKFLEERVKTAKEELDKTENLLQNYKIENKIINPTANAEIIADRIAEVEKQAAANRIEQEAAEARLATVNSQLGGTGAASADNQALQQYNKQLAELETAYIGYKDKYTAKHPKMIDLESSIAKLKEKIKEEQAKISSLQAPSDNLVHQGLVSNKFSSESAVKVYRQKGEALQKVIDENNAELEKLPEVEKGYVRLARDNKVAYEIYSMLIRKLEETKITEYQQPNNVLIIDAPTLPDEPVSPRKGLTLILSAILGLLGSSSYVILKELANKTVRSAEDVKQYIELPVLGSIPSEFADLEAIVETKEIEQHGWKEKLKEFIWKN